ncbi:MAG: sigma 54-interacting transcriptional regulator [Eubacteriaceae bacterium]|nr:sigma 54-interacting transcriptional regulator [Eubacteriaceae bacterium]
MELQNDYKLFLDHICGLIVINTKGECVYLNDQCADYINVDKNTAVGKPIKEVFPPSTMEEMLNSDSQFNVQFYFTEGRMSVSSQVQLKKEGKITGVLEYDMIQDIESLDNLLDKYAQSVKNEMHYYREQMREFKSTKYSINNILGSSKKVQDLKKQIEFAATSNSTVLITGETGTGKELVAQSIHNLSARAFGEFIKVNSAGIPSNLVESELFGYEEGSFTGAKKGGKKGKFVLADKGTLFIDEINHMPLDLQPKLLRALQEGEIDPVGAEESIGVDVRIIAATNESLESMVREHTFREDLFYRLNVFPITVPPLRDRLEDIPEIVESKIKSLNNQMSKNISSVEKSAYSNLYAYNWPGNIRELLNVVERAMNFETGNILTKKSLDLALSGNDSKYIDRVLEEGSGYKLIDKVRNDSERELLLQVLSKFEGNKTQSANYLGIARPLLYQKMKRLGIR